MCVANSRVNWAPYVREAAPWRNSFLHKCGHYMLYCLAFVPEAPIRNLQDLNAENSESLASTIVITKLRQLGKLAALSDKKRIPEFVHEIKTMIDNGPSKSIRTIARDTGLSKFLIRKRVHEDIRYLSYKIRKGQQDSAPRHTSKRTLAWLSDNSSDHIIPDMRPPNSPDCNPLINTHGAK